MKRLSRALKTSCVFLLASAPVSIGMADAQVYKYTYKSANYTDFVEGGTCLTSLMHATITLYLPTPIPANVRYYQVNPISWVASNGLHVFSSASKDAVLDYGIFSTDAKGKITNWSIDVYAYPKGPLEYASTDNTVGDTPQDDGSQYPCPDGYNVEARSFTPAAWKQPKH